MLRARPPRLGAGGVLHGIMAEVAIFREFRTLYPETTQETVALTPLGASRLTDTVTSPGSACVVNTSFWSDSTATAGVASTCR